MSKYQHIVEDVGLRPVGSRVLVRKLDQDRVTKSGIILPADDREKPLMADVLAAGQGRITAANVLLPMEVKAGDRVLFERYAGTEVKAGEKAAVLLLEMDDIIAVVTEDENAQA